MTDRLYHYSASPFAFDPTRVYQQDHGMKPRGLWLSVEDEAEAFGWKTWCVRESFNLDNLQHRTQVVLAADANILHLASPEAIDAFTREFPLDGAMRSSCQQIDWTTVARRYQGLIIAPYQWERRLTQHTFWYYCWDCASGCIWDCAAVATEVHA